MYQRAISIARLPSQPPLRPQNQLLELGTNPSRSGTWSKARWAHFRLSAIPLSSTETRTGGLQPWVPHGDPVDPSVLLDSRSRTEHRGSFSGGMRRVCFRVPGAPSMRPSFCDADQASVRMLPQNGELRVATTLGSGDWSVREPQHDDLLSAGNRQGRCRKSAGETAVEGQGSCASARAEHWHAPSLTVRMARI